MAKLAEDRMPGYLTHEERALIRGRRVGLDEVASLRAWYPVVALDDGLCWRYFGDRRFTEPFFHDTLTSLGEPERLCLQTDYDALEGLADTLAPTAFFFHASRCGSTLLCQLLAKLPGCVVMSEPPALDSFLRRYYTNPDMPDAEQKLRAIVAALGQKRFAEDRHFFVKLHSWHIGSLPLFRRAFPDTSFLFLYRQADEVMASHRRQRGPHMVPGLVDGAMPPSFVIPPVPAHDLEGYCAKVLEYFYGTALAHADELICVDYRQLPNLVWDELLDIFSIATTPEQLEAMRSRAGFHSKSRGAFTGDPDTKSAQNEVEMEALERYYEQLNALRFGGNTSDAQ